MRVGFAALDITPAIGIELAGFIAREGPSIGVHDPLYAKALVFEDDGARAAIVVVDLIGLGRNLVRRVRERVAASVGIPTRAQLYSCTHTHGGPETGTLTTMARTDLAYLRALEGSLVSVVEQATARLVPARFGTAEGSSSMGQNRVFARQSEVGTTDPTVALLRIADESGAPLATVVNYACHATSAGPVRLINADYPCCLSRALESAGRGPTLFVNGPGADANPRMPGGRGFGASRLAGELLAEEAIRLWSLAEPNDVSGIRAEVSRVRLPLAAPLSPKEAEMLDAEGRMLIESLAPESRERRAVEVTHLAHAAHLAQLHFGRLDGRLEVESEVQVLRLGPVAVVGLPGESFSSASRAIRAAVGGPAIVAGWANDLVGYIADEPTHRRGGYEVEIAHRYYGQLAPFAVEAHDNLVITAGRLLAEIGFSSA